MRVGAVGLRGRAELRARWKAVAGLALLIAVAGGVVVAAAAGARRTDSAMDRFFGEFRPDDGEVDTNAPEALRAIAALPQVEDLSRSGYVALSTSPRGRDLGALGFFAAVERGTLRRFDRPHVVAGRMFRYGRADEVVVNELAARRFHLQVGSRLRVYSFTVDQLKAIFTSAFGRFPDPAGPSARLRVVGIVRQPSDVQPQTNDDVVYLGSAYAVLPPAFLRSPAGRSSQFATEGIAQFRLRPGTDFDRFARAAARVGGQDVTPNADRTRAAGAQRAIHIQAVALALFAALVALASVLVIGELLAREVAGAARDRDLLRALGFTRRGLMAVLLIPTAIATSAGGVAIVVVAWLVSPLTPIGLARDAEIHPGFSFNGAVLLIGAAAFAVVMFARAAFGAWAVTRRVVHPQRTRPSPVVAAAARAGLSTPVVLGARMALDPGPPSARVPVRPSLSGAAVGVAGVVAAVVFAASLNGLVGDPVRQGWNWDAIVGNPNSLGTSLDQYTNVLRKHPGVIAFTPLGEARLRVADRAVPVLGIGTGRGLVAPPVLEGRIPAAKDEVALGDDTLGAAHAHLGERVTVTGPGGRVRARIVGRVLLPAAAAAAFNFGSGLRRGAVMTEPGIVAVGGAVTPPRLIAIRLAPRADRRRVIADLRHRFGRVVLARADNADVDNLERIRQLPAAFGLLLGLFALASVAYALYASGRRRRRDLALFRTFGLSRRQLTATVSAQGTILAIAAALIGIPAGIILGRVVWSAVATAVAGVDPRPVVPGFALLIGTVVGLAAVNLLAVGPGLRAARVRPAVILRAE